MRMHLGLRGEIVIPKKVREYLGFTRETPLLLSVKERSIELRVARQDVIERWAAQAKAKGVKSSSLVYGDALYEKVF